MKNMNQLWESPAKNSALHDLYAQLGQCDYMYIRCNNELELLEQRRNEILNKIETTLNNGNRTVDNNDMGTDKRV